MRRATADAVELPAAPRSTATSAYVPCRPGLEAVLLVDDQDDVRSLLAEVLRLGSYRVLEAQFGFSSVHRIGASALKYRRAL